jgi:hypothetical protein
MKKLFLTTALLIAAITTANAQSLKVGNVTISYNAPAAENIGFTLDVTNAANGGSGSGLCKDAATAIGHVQKLCGCVLTPNEALKVYSIAKQQPPQWLLDNAKVKTL